jgi:MFS superfamily sulfate permease-like transporter
MVFGTEADFARKVSALAESWPTGFFLKTWAVLVTLLEANFTTTVIGVGALVVLFACKRFLPSAPSALIAVILSVFPVWLLGLDERGVSVIGEVESGMVHLAVPVLNLGEVLAVMPGALAIVLLGYSVSLSVAAVGAQATGEEINPNQELVGLGVANLGAALSAGFVVCGSLSRGVVIRRAGGQTQVVSLINAVLVLLTLVFVLPLFFKLPNATLSAIVIGAMVGLLNFAYFRRLLLVDRAEFAYAMAALFGVLVLGILNGVALGVALSLAVLIHRVSRPGTAILGRLPGTHRYRDITVHAEAETIPGLLIFRFDAPILFFNVGFFVDEIRRLIAGEATPVRGVLVPAQQINQIDSASADQLVKLHQELEWKGITFSFAEVKAPLREMMRRTGLEEKLGADHFHESIEDGVLDFLRHLKRVTGKPERQGVPRVVVRQIK